MIIKVNYRSEEILDNGFEVRDGHQLRNLSPVKITMLKVEC